MAIQLYSYAQIEDGLSGYFNETSDPTRKRFSSNACMFLLITGASASLKVNAGGPSPYKVFVDGVPNVPAIAGGEIVLFTGLTDEQHVVGMIPEPGYTTDFNWLTIGEPEILSVDGVVPAMTPVPTEFVSWPTYLGRSSEPTVPALGGNVTPTYPQVVPLTQARGEIVIHAQCDEIHLFCGQNVIKYSVDGGAINTVNIPDNDEVSRLFLLADGLDNSGVHKYTIWDGDQADTPIQGVACLNNSVPATVQSPGAKTSIFQYGDSITYGIGSTPGDVSCWQVGLNLDLLMAKLGVSGQNISGLTTMLPDYFAEMGTSDYALLAIGRNDVGGATIQADYIALIQAFLDEGVTNILCQGILPEGANLWPAENADIEAAVDSFSNPNIIFIPTTTWLGIDTVDGVHPSAAGQAQVAGYLTPVLADILATPEGGTNKTVAILILHRLLKIKEDEGDN